MKLGIVYQFFQDESQPGHSITYRLVEYLSENGADVNVYAGQTGYMRSRENSLGFIEKIINVETIAGAKIIRTYSYNLLHKSKLGRAFNMLSFSISSFLGIVFTKKRDVYMLSSPPLFCTFTASIACILIGRPFIAEIRDLWPESLIQMGVLSNSLVIKVMQMMEKFVYLKAEKIIVLTQGIADGITKTGIPEDKIVLIPCSVNTENIHPNEEDANNLRTMHTWEDKCIILYFGALGEANNLEVVIKAAQKLKNNNKILFLLIGDGIKKKDYQKQITTLDLNNIKILPSVPKNDASAYISMADICLVTLKEIGIFKGAIPTKLIDYMACAKPVLCGVDGEAKHIVERANSGVFFRPNDEDDLVDKILNLLDNKKTMQIYGKNGLQYIKKYHSSKRAFQKYSHFMTKVSEVM